jgi:diguanylate cyclase (GGDEF)-like protein
MHTRARIPGHLACESITTRGLSVRLIAWNDTPLAAALIAGTFIIFQRPLGWLLDLAHDAELRYHVDLLPALTILTVAFAFQQYHKRQQARAEALAAAAEAAEVRARSEELQRLMTFGQSIGHALDRATLQQALWRALPAFVAERACWLLARDGEGWELLLQDARAIQRQSVETLEALSARAISEVDFEKAQREGVQLGEELAFPLTAGGAVIGVMGVRSVPPLANGERRALAAMSATVAIAVRNVRLLHETRENGVRDGLTGCFNRAHGVETLQSELRRSRRSGRPLSIVMLDLDRFKTVNDSAGHLHGDAVLAAVGSRLAQVLRSTDVRVRYGGDEFVIILTDTPIIGAQQVAEGLRREIAELRLASSEPAGVTASLGVVAAVPGEMEPLALIARADEALYRAKHEGRNRFCLAQPKAAAYVVSTGPTAVGR